MRSTLKQMTTTSSALFESVPQSADMVVDGVLRRKIVNQCADLEQETQGIDAWHLYDCGRVDEEGYDANGIIIFGMNSHSNEVHQIGPLILHKSRLQ